MLTQSTGSSDYDVGRNHVLGMISAPESDCHRGAYVKGFETAIEIIARVGQIMGLVG